jgi:hypothetical protein
MGVRPPTSRRSKSRFATRLGMMWEDAAAAEIEGQG